MMSPMRASFLSESVTVSVVSASFASSFTLQPSTFMAEPSAVFAFTFTVFLPAARVRRAFISSKFTLIVTGWVTVSV